MKVVLFLLAAILWTADTLQAQSVTDRLGGVTTGFTFFCDSLDLGVEDQIIIVSFKRGSFLYYGPGEIAETYRQEFTYQTYSLEFSLRNEICIDRQMVSKKAYESTKQRHFYEVMLFDKQGAMTGKYTIPVSNITSTTNNLTSPGDIRYFYSLDLTEIPMVLINRTSIIKIREVIISQW